MSAYSNLEAPIQIENFPDIVAKLTYWRTFLLIIQPQREKCYRDTTNNILSTYEV